MALASLRPSGFLLGYDHVSVFWVSTFCRPSLLHYGFLLTAGSLIGGIGFLVWHAAGALARSLESLGYFPDLGIATSRWVSV